MVLLKGGGTLTVRAIGSRSNYVSVTEVKNNIAVIKIRFIHYHMRPLWDRNGRWHGTSMRKAMKWINNSKIGLELRYGL